MYSLSTLTLCWSILQAMKRGTIQKMNLGSVDVHLSQSIVAAIEMKAEKLVSVLQ